MKNLSKIIMFLFFLIMAVGCCTEENITFRDGQSETVINLRKSGYHEYSSKLNDVIFAELNSWESDVISIETIETISVFAEKLKKEQNKNGCYVIEWQSRKSQPHTNTITLEWNEEQGVIIRIFTLSEKIKQILPLQSYS